MYRTRYFNPKFTSNIFLYHTIYEFADGQTYLNWNPFLQSLVLEKEHVWKFGSVQFTTQESQTKKVGQRNR